MTNLTKTIAKTIPLTACLALALPGCLRQGGMTDEDYDDVAVALGSLVSNPSGGELGSIEDSLALAEGQQQLVEGASGRLVIVRQGLTYEYLADCFDAAGDLQPVCDAATTDTAAIAVSWTGDLDLPNYQANIQRDGEWTFAGLLGDVVTLDGAGSFDIETHFQAIYRPVTKDLVLEYDATYEGVQYDRIAQRIVAGTIEYAVSGERTVTRGDRTREGTFEVNAEVTFDAAGVATIVLDGSRTYTVDIATGAVTGL